MDDEFFRCNSSVLAPFPNNRTKETRRSGQCSCLTKERTCVRV